MVKRRRTGRVEVHIQPDSDDPHSSTNSSHSPHLHQHMKFSSSASHVKVQNIYMPLPINKNGSESFTSFASDISSPESIETLNNHVLVPASSRAFMPVGDRFDGVGMEHIQQLDIVWEDEEDRTQCKRTAGVRYSILY